jgi:mono/diheme cytochrome c family protein
LSGTPAAAENDLRAVCGEHFSMTVPRWLPLILSALAFCTSLDSAVRADDADLGREVYDEYCAICHGRDMVNSGGVTFDLRKFPKDDFARFRNSVLSGKPPAMPPWRDKLSDDDIKLLWAYVSGS